MNTKIYLSIEVKNVKPTKKHRPAVWEGILGTVYAMNKERVTQYFDYDYEGAKKYAGVTNEADEVITESDLRIFKNVPPCYSWDGRGDGYNPAVNQWVLWVKDEVK